MRLLLLALAVTCLGCGFLPGMPSTRPQQDTARAAVAPEWRPGDRWVYRWANGTQTGTRTVEVLESREVGGIPYYVLKTTPDSDFLNYWTLDLGWAFSVTVRDRKVEARIDRPVPWFNWPLEVGRRWSHQGLYEDRGGKRETNDAFMVVAAESIDVPAGRFQAVKVVREAQSVDSDQYWYAPEVRSYVKWILKRGDKRVEEELVEYKPVERLIPRPAKAPSKPK